MDSKKSTVSPQQNLKDQMHAVDTLTADFLNLMWAEQGTDYSASKARYEKHLSVLEAAGHLLPHVVMCLFARLEERAIYEVDAAAALAQTTDPDSIALQRPNLPKLLVHNVHAVHQHAYKTSQSKQASDAASGRRPGRHHPDRQRVIIELENRIKSNLLDPTIHGQKAPFIKEMLETFPNVKLSKTIYKWINEHLNKNT